MTRLEQRGGGAIAFMAAALWIKPIDFRTIQISL